jgi:hypothetical protein
MLKFYDLYHLFGDVFDSVNPPWEEDKFQTQLTGFVPLFLAVKRMSPYLSSVPLRYIGGKGGEAWQYLNLGTTWKWVIDHLHASAPFSQWKSHMVPIW